ncbi:MAG: hypothetical protein QOE94_1485 [Mycobacterium sp.]|jgi:hypothetical protein|nr:hypothetical protein [Mycobacterium sp.]
MATIKKYQNTSGATSYMVRHRKPDQSQTTKRGFTTKRARRRSRPPWKPPNSEANTSHR